MKENKKELDKKKLKKKEQEDFEQKQKRVRLMKDLRDTIQFMMKSSIP